MRQVWDLSPLERAVSSLKRGLERAEKNLDDEELRDACIQRFELTYELCWKMLRRYLAADAPADSTVRESGYRDLIRLGARRGLIVNPQAWFTYRTMRNLTSHTYNPQKAKEIFTSLAAFLGDAQALLNALKINNHA